MSDEELIKKYVREDLQEEALKKLKTGYPVQYIIGNVEFYDLLIDVNEDVLIPRFETEYLVEKTIKYINRLNIINPNILDIGTGSGCIAIALKKNINSNVKAIDISENAINLAKKNAINNNANIEFEVLDINDFNETKKYDVIISNPPYVSKNKHLDEKTKYEPINAIVAEDNGLYFYKVILNKIKNNLNNKFLIAFEIDDKQGKEITDVTNSIFNNVNIYIEKDYNNYERYLFITSK